VTGEPSAWRTYVVDPDGRRLTPALVGPAADFTHPDSPGSLALMALPAAAGMELEHAPTGIRIIVPRLSAFPLEDWHRLSQLPSVLRAAAEFVDPPHRGPRRGPKVGWQELRFAIVELWVTTGKKPAEADIAAKFHYETTALSRAVRGSSYSIRRSARSGQGSGWDNQLAVAAMFIRQMRAKVPAPAPDESEIVQREREMLERVDLTGF
jgi:hypothetical protein